MERILRYREALAEALCQALELDPTVFVLGVGVADPKGIFGTVLEARRRFPDRVLETPLSENVLTGACVGAALSGRRPVLVHARADFLFVAMDQLINNAAKWLYMSDGQAPVPMTIRAIIGRGWGQGAQHSQSPQAIFAHTPGLKVAMPSTPENAKGLLLAAIRDPNPVLVFEHRGLYEHEGPVPTEAYETPLGVADVVHAGDDVTIVATSLACAEALEAAELLAQEGVGAEVVDLRSIAPLDHSTVLASVRRTGRLVVADTGPSAFGVAAEVGALVAERAFEALRAPIRRVGLPHVPTPTSWVLEGEFYPGAGGIVDAALATVGRERRAVEAAPVREAQPAFQGPF